MPNLSLHVKILVMKGVDVILKTYLEFVKKFHVVLVHIAVGQNWLHFNRVTDSVHLHSVRRL